MSKLMVGLMTGLVALALTGCGTSPSTATGSFKASTAKAASKSAPAAKAKAPSVSSRSTSKAPAKSTTPAAPQAPAAQDPEAGSLKIALKVTGNAPVASLALKVFEQTDPSVSIDVPVTLNNGSATWAADDVAPGRYTFQVQALGADKGLLGSGNGEAIVTAGKATEVSLDLRVNTMGIADTTDDETDDTPTQIGGTIGLNIEIY